MMNMNLSSLSRRVKGNTLKALISCSNSSRTLRTNALAPLGNMLSPMASPSWPFEDSPVSRLERSLLSDWPFSGLAPSTMSPPDLMRITLREDDEHFHVEAEIPGVQKSDINVDLLPNNILQVSCEKREDTSQSDDRFIRKERYYGRVERSIRLPQGNIELEDVKAEYTDGVLAITVPKPDRSEASGGRHIEVQ